MSIKLLSLNIEGDKHLELVEELIRENQPDVICLQEVYALDVERLSFVLPNLSAQYLPIVSYDEPNRYDIAPRGQWGLLVLTKQEPLKVWQQAYKGDLEDIPSFTDGQPNSANRAILGVQIKNSDQTLNIFTTHFTWTGNGKPSPEQFIDLEQMLEFLEDKPTHVLCGDFNAPRGEAVFDQLAGVYTDNIPLDVKTTIDGQFHYAGDLQLVVDGLFSSPEYDVTAVQVVGGVSDHKAILAQLDRN